MKIIVDMNMSTKWVAALGAAGFAAQHWSSLGSPDAQDAQIMAVALSQDAIVLTRDLDFSAILAATGMGKPSVVHLREEDRFEPIVVSRVVLALKAFELELKAGAVLTLSANKARIRLLPFQQAEGAP